jgi:MerR family mercuric resistance operon transcriptional regulator
MREESYTVGRLAKKAGVNVETIRYYQRRGLLPIPASSPGSVRRYSGKYLERLRFIKRSQQLGFTLGEAAELMALSEGHGCSVACGVAERRLADVERKMADLAAMQQALRRLVGRCHENPPEAPCPLVEAITR